MSTTSVLKTASASISWNVLRIAEVVVVKSVQELQLIESTCRRFLHIRIAEHFVTVMSESELCYWTEMREAGRTHEFDRNQGTYLAFDSS